MSELNEKNLEEVTGGAIDHNVMLTQEIPEIDLDINTTIEGFEKCPHCGWDKAIGKLCPHCKK